ncbi:Protein of unknown function [Planctomicrobium piriforme]|uniref:DUF1552 domain-containing protein n=1 Tax=Planctomicrobium piriforme TaxID=1576369 RepID=A0A1I3D5P4_9PLAN|nr:Protein of unknown function [Planctomicrobium piriforme]
MLAALPFLESIAPTIARAGTKIPVRPPVRFGICSVTGGTVTESWVPSEQGPLGKLPSILKPLEAHKSDFLVLSNLSHSGESDGTVGDAHEHCAFVHLTGAQKVAKVDGKPAVGQSVDQRAADLLREESLIHSLNLGYAGGEQPFYFDQTGRPLPVERDPLITFERMFKGRSLVAPNWARRGSPQNAAAIAAGPRSNDEQVVDLILDDAKRLKRQLGTSDRGKLSEYMESVHNIEQRARRMQARINAEMLDAKEPGPSHAHAPEKLPSNRDASQKMVNIVTQDPSIHSEYLTVMMDLMILAFQTDTTRVCSLGLGSDEALFPGVVTVGYETHAHTLEHHGNGFRPDDADPVAREGCRQIHAWYTKHFAAALAKMKAIDEGGSSLLDNTMLLYTSYMSHGGHGRSNYPVLLAGRAGGRLNPGRHIAYQADTPAANLYVEILDRLGDTRGEFGNSRTSPKAAYDGRLPGLV